MKKGCIIAAIAILVIVVLVVVVAAIVIDSKYGAVTTANRVSHRTVAPADAGIRLVADPALGEPILEKHVFANMGGAAAFAQKGMPYELAFFIAPGLDDNVGNLTVFINEQRLGPVIAEEVTRMVLAGQVPYATWPPDGMVLQERGILLLEGDIPLSPVYIEVAREIWGVVSPLPPPEVEGGHFIEAAIDNRDGGAYALFGSLFERHNQGPLPFDRKELARSLWLISIMRIQADPASPDDLSLRVVLECNPEAGEGDIGTLAFLIGMLRGEVAKGLQESYGAGLEGTVRQEGLNVICEYTVTNIGPMLEDLVKPAPEELEPAA